MAAPPKYPSELRDRIHTLVNEDRQTGAQALKILQSEGHPQLPSEPVLRTIASEERRKRGSVKDMARDEALDTLTRRLFGVADRRIRGMERARDVDPNELLTMAKALRELQPLAQAKSNTGPQTTDTPLQALEQAQTHRPRQRASHTTKPGSLTGSARPV